jgi:hypothetical protein
VSLNSWWLEFSYLLFVCLLGVDFGTVVESFERNLRLPFTPLWSPFPVIQLVSEPVKDDSTLIGP